MFLPSSFSLVVLSSLIVVGPLFRAINFAFSAWPSLQLWHMIWWTLAVSLLVLISRLSSILNGKIILQSLWNVLCPQIKVEGGFLYFHWHAITPIRWYNIISRAIQNHLRGYIFHSILFHTPLVSHESLYNSSCNSHPPFQSSMTPPPPRCTLIHVNELSLCPCGKVIITTSKQQ